MYDVIVVGLGGMGSAAAYQLAGRGKKVLGLERHTPAHDKGSSHGQSRIIRQAYFEGAEYVPLVLRAYELWERLEKESGEDLMSLIGGLMIGDRHGELVSGSIESADAHGLPYRLLDSSELRRRFPVFAPDLDTVALYEERAGFVRPEASVQAHLDRARKLGAELRFEEPVVSWEASESGDRVRVRTAHGSYEAERLVISAGPWSPELLSEMNIPLQVERLVLHWFEPKGGIESFAPDHLPIWIWDPPDGNSFYSFPHLDNDRGIKVAFFRAGGTHCDPKTIDREVHEEETEFLRSYLTKYVPSLAGRSLDAKTCMYTNTPDQHFVLSKHPEHPQVAVACGFSGHGYKFCSVVGEILADLAIEGATPHPIELFSPSRLAKTTVDRS